MTSITQLKLAGGAGTPDSIGPRRLDVVIAAEALCDARDSGDYQAADEADMRLAAAVERLRKARRDAAEQRGIA